MSRRIQGRVITAAALVAALALANPVHAASRGMWGNSSGLFLHAWQWLTGASPVVGTRAQSGRHSITKSGMGVDPQGAPGEGAAPGINVPVQSDGGAGVDPNG
jgi:hypothetical protein